MNLKKIRLLSSFSAKIALGMALTLPVTYSYAATEIYGGFGASVGFVQSGDITTFGQSPEFVGNDLNNYPSFNTQMGGEAFFGAMFGNFGAELKFSTKSLQANKDDLLLGINFPDQDVSVPANDKGLFMFDYTNMMQNSARISGVYTMNLGSFKPYVSAGVGGNVITGIPLSQPLLAFAVGGRIGTDFKISDKVSLYAAYDLDAAMSPKSKTSDVITATGLLQSGFGGGGDEVDCNNCECPQIPGDNTPAFALDVKGKIFHTSSPATLEQVALIDTESAIPTDGSYAKISNVTIIDGSNPLPLTFNDGSPIFTTNAVLELGFDDSSYKISDDSKQALMLFKYNDTEPKDPIDDVVWAVRLKDDTFMHGILEDPNDLTSTGPGFDKEAYVVEGKASSETAKYFLVTDTDTLSGGIDILPFIDGTASVGNNKDNRTVKATPKAGASKVKATKNSPKEITLPDSFDATTPLKFSSLLTHNISFGVKFNF